MAKLGRTLCVTSNFPRWHGDSTTPFVLHLAEDLAALGWQVDVLAPHAPNAKRFEAFGKVNVYRFRYLWPESQQTVCYQGGALVNLRKNPFNKLKLPLLVAAQFFAMFWRLLIGKYDVIHAHWLVPQGFNAVLLGCLFGLPTIVTAHGSDVFGLRGALITRFKRFVLSHASVVTANSQFTHDGVIRIISSIQRLEKIPMGVSTEPLSLAERNEVTNLRSRYRSGTGPLLVFVGRLVEEKGISDLLEATALLAPEYDEITVIIAGEGQDRNEFERQAESLGISDKTFFVGWVDPGSVRAFMAAADFFVGPSRTSAEGGVEAQGLTFVEAMSVGTLPIGSRLGGIKESIVDGVTGYLVDERSPQQIANVIRVAMSDKSQWPRMKRKARNAVMEKFSRDVSARKFSSLFQSIISVTIGNAGME